jgi:molybdenum cofactor cytidylyltransferase
MSATDVRARVAAVVLAAGAGTRFGGAKLGAMLEGRPMLQHVLDAVRALGPERCVVVLGADAEELEAAVDWRDEVRVRNPAPNAGLSGSLRLGVAESQRVLPGLLGVLVVLGDQPRTSPDVMRALVDLLPAALAQGAWAVVPDYAAGGGANPALVLGDGLARIPELRGDRGLGALLAADPGRSLRVRVPGSNPDVDTMSDLSAIANGAAVAGLRAEGGGSGGR